MRLIRLILPWAMMLCAVFARAEEESWFGMYLQGAKVGYFKSVEKTVHGDPKIVRIAESLTVLKSKLLGSDLEISIASATSFDAAGRPVTLNYVTESNGRKQTVDAIFGADSIQIALDNSGQKSSKTLSIPKGARIVDDASSAVMLGEVSPKPFDVYVLDPTTVSLIKNRVTFRGKQGVDVRGSRVEAQKVEILDPRAITNVYFSEKGDVLKVEAAMGIIIYPESKEVALDFGTAPRPDLATATALKTTPPIENPRALKELRLRITGPDLSSLPGDANQFMKREGGSWIIHVKPSGSSPEARGTLRKSAAKRGTAGKTEWLRPGMHIPSDDSKFKLLSAKIVGEDSNCVSAAEKIAKWIGRNLTPDAGIGVLRDANEVLTSKVGVCRDYAILAATLMRAADIPTRLVAGLIYEDDRFYYHAWVEIWTGRVWMPLDPTRADSDFDATHVKIAQGSVETAFTFKVLESAKIEVVSTRQGGG